MEKRKLNAIDESFYWGRTGTQSTVLIMRCDLTQEVDPQVLESALVSALRVHTNFRVRPVVENGRLMAIIDDVTKAPLFKDDGQTKRLGTDELDGLVLYAAYGEKHVTFHVFHGIADLRGIAAFIKTVFSFYFNALGLTDVELPEPDSFDTAPLYETIMALENLGTPDGMFIAEEHDIFHLPVQTYGKETTRQRVIEMQVPLQPVLTLAKESNSSVMPTFQAIIGHAIRKTYDVGQQEVVCYTPTDLRQMFGIQSGGNGSSSISVPYPAEYDSLDIHERAMRLRADMRAQLQPANFYATITGVMGNLKPLADMPYPIDVIAPRAVDAGRARDTESYTYGISYGGKISFGEQVDPYVTSIIGYTGTYSYPIWVVASELNGVLNIMLLQNYESDELAKAIFDELSALFPQTSYTDKGYADIDELHISDLKHI